MLYTPKQHEGLKILWKFHGTAFRVALRLRHVDKYFELRVVGLREHAILVHKVSLDHDFRDAPTSTAKVIASKVRAIAGFELDTEYTSDHLASRFQ